MNDKCNNYKQELDGSPETCSLCGEPVTKIETNVNPKLGLAAIAAALAGPILFWFGLSWTMVWIGVILNAAAIVVSFISKSKPSIVISFLGLAMTAFLFVYWQFLM